MPSSLCVSAPPGKPLLLFDGACHFCRRWIERWRLSTGSAVEYAASQEERTRFPEIPETEWDRSIQLIETDGRVHSGAEAVLRTLALGPARPGKWLWQMQQSLPLFAYFSEEAYRFIARHRTFASACTKFLWGDDVRPPQYFATRRWFLRALGAIYFVAFVSIWVQVDGLMGEHGIVPAGDFLAAVRHDFGTSAIRTWPTLCWLSSSRIMLHALCAIGTTASLLLLCSLVPIVALLVSFACYLSLVVAGESFFSFQWDILLLETGFLAVFLAPWQGRMRRGHDAIPSGLALFSLKLLLFKVMFMSGVVKLTSGDSCWWDLTALDYHYWTQPLPTVFAWFADKAPESFKKFSVAATLFVEIVVPFFIWAPRRLRLTAAALLVALQLAIAFTGNYCFFNLLIIALCLLLIDDSFWRKGPFREQPGSRLGWPLAVPLAVVAVTAPVNLSLALQAIYPSWHQSRVVGAMAEQLTPYHLVNGYGLFRVMTKERPEIVVEGSDDGVRWLSYEFKWKPGDLRRAPRWNAPHQPRLDWLMWFAALGSGRDKVCVEYFAVRLLENETAVTHLLARNPFPDRPPKYLRAELFNYRFATHEERRATGEWWKRELRGEYFPMFSLDDVRH